MHQVLGYFVNLNLCFLTWVPGPEPSSNPPRDVGRVNPGYCYPGWAVFTLEANPG